MTGHDRYTGWKGKMDRHLDQYLGSSRSPRLPPFPMTFRHHPHTCFPVSGTTVPSLAQFILSHMVANSYA